MSPRMGLSGGLGRCVSSRLPRLTFGLRERPQGSCGPWLQSSPQTQELPPCYQKPADCSTTSWAVSLASFSCHPHPGLLPTAEASLPAGAGGQCHNSLSILPGPVRAMRQPGPSEQDLGVQAAYCTGELLPSFSGIEYGLVALEPLPIMSPFPPHSPEFPRMETGKSKFQ